MKFQQNTAVQILNGRPQPAAGLPIGLFHPVFDRFRELIDSTKFDATPEQLSSTLSLIKASQDLYALEGGEKGRTAAILPLLNSVLDCSISATEIPRNKSDGTVQTRNGAYTLVVEVKNEIGTGGSDPSVQGAIAYAKYWGQSQNEWLRCQSCCPSFILAIAGPWMCILGGIMLEHPVVQPLTPFLPVANNPSSVLYPGTIAKTLAALAQSLNMLDGFYGNFLRSGGLDPTRFFPHVQHFTRDGQRVDIHYRIRFPGKTVFRAQARPSIGDPYPIVVKFTESYNAGAHRLLEKDKLAPQLFFVSSEQPKNQRFAERIMVVMEEVVGRDSEGAPVNDLVRNDVLRALNILHDKRLVFGDLRRPNIMTVEDGKGGVIGGMLVDFDWCGVVGQARYPSDINPAIEWPEGVGPGLVIRPEHDRDMYQKLRYN
ncbi:hypothetical protein RSOLAG1IB_11251 [Rhizoctonia solani AG-1 IB]|uniref:Protein kinase domain-containing protein n=1 Tax=Thanatephorus cucumeris (strain AG1-IB / isolate 7/3/14) TaxID=1108050 RepID=A0A0B7F8C2_THACB|nr:hypothetical protein RSOLAG1IB_11251 [Rhizoctonia solani AG-1 IB]